MERNLRKTRVGVVVSDKMDKTIVVAVKDSVCCFSKRMRKVFRKNEKSMLQNCNKKAKRKRRLQRVKKPM